VNFNNLIKGNRTYYARYYKLVALAVAITTAVLTGSLVIGDSVRSTLVNRVNERLGNTETVVFSMQSFMDSSLVHHSVFEGHTRSMLISNGFISQSGRLIPVMVWGVDDMSIQAGKARINESLAKELNISAGKTVRPSSLSTDIVLRLPATGLVPSGSLYVTDNYTTGLRLEFDGIVDVAQQGNLSLKNEQTLPLNVFVNLDELAQTIETEGKINLMLSDRQITAEELAHAWNPSVSGLKATAKEGFTEITADRIFIQNEVVQTIAADYPQTDRLFSYLINSMSSGDRDIHYSFATAMDSYNGRTLSPDEIIVSDYTARRMNVKPGDSLALTFFTSSDLKTLKIDTVTLRVSRIVPISELAADTTLSAKFPGMSEAANCTDWNSDMPIDMTKITDEDEKYWDDYRSTPKAIIPYSEVAARWSNSYGSATALRIPVSTTDITPWKGLESTMFGIQLTHPRESAYKAARGGVDFSSLFLSLGFFIILSAILLMLVPLSEMLFRRKDETTLMHSLGYTTRRIVSLFRKESLAVVLWSSLAGVAAGLIYTWLVLFLLGTIWKGATHTEGFSLYPDVRTIAIGLIIGVLLSAGLIWYALGRSLRQTVKHKNKKQPSLRLKLLLAILFSIAVCAIAIINQAFIQSVGLFVVVGVLFIGAAAFWGDYMICRSSVPSSRPFTDESTLWKSLFADRKQVVLSFFSLAMGVFIVFAVGLNRQGFADSEQLTAGTGGYSLWCESAVPVYHNLSTPLGREKLALTDLPADAEVLQLLRYGADDASCLNLNKVSTPTVLGIDMEHLGKSLFKIGRIWEQPGVDTGTKTPADMEKLLRTRTDSVYPALVDETVLTWGLGLKLGDTIVYEGSRGQRAVLRLTGTLQNTIFQGNILIDRNLFTEIWDEIGGSEVMLVKVDATETESVKSLISQAMSNYGVRVMTTNDRLKMFNSVTDTYLTIFLMLGSIGMLLGIMSFIIVVRKNLASRREEINVYRSLGFPDGKIAHFLRIENNTVPIYAIGTGVIGAILAAGGGMANVTMWVWIASLVFSTLFIIGVMVFIRLIINKIMVESK
jgi:putative ABC transport system permease protein